MTRVFISSTLKDLERYRADLTDALNRAGVEVVRQEAFVSPSEIATEEIKAEIEKADALILIVGHRYGTIEKTSGKSYTELEFELARNLDKPVLAFLQSDDALVRPEEIDRDSTKVMEFRDQVKSDRLVSFFHTPGELVSNVLTSVLHLVNRKEISERPEPEADVTPLQKQVHILRLLLSSPGDVQNERTRVSNAVFRFNQLAVREHEIFIELVRWEDMAPQIGPTAQNVINAQIGKYELFAGIMWNRFGTPTEIAASGTEEEFNGAFELWEANRSPWITFYFCDRPANFNTTEQLTQKLRVIEFRARLQKHGVTRAYVAPEQFEEMFFQDLLRIVLLPEFRKMNGLPRR